MEREPSWFWTALVIYSSYLSLDEVYEDIKQLYEEGMIDSFIFSFEEMEDYLFLGWENNLKWLKIDREYRFIDDTISSMEWWACFNPPRKKRKRIDLEAKRVTELLDSMMKSRKNKIKPKAKAKKIGPNDPCPCGSGKKYKKCCGAI